MTAVASSSRPHPAQKVQVVGLKVDLEDPISSAERGEKGMRGLLERLVCGIVGTGCCLGERMAKMQLMV